MPEKELSNRVAVVTGGSGGIGRSICRRLADEGAAVAVVSTTLEKARQVVDELQKSGADALAVTADLSNPEDVRKMAETILNHWGKVDILVNNAGIRSRSANLWELEYDEWRKVISVDLDSVFLCCKAFIPQMIERKRGRIINVSSTYGIYGAPMQSAYSSAKGGIVALTKALAKELAPYQILAHTVVPGYIGAGMGEHVPPDEYEQAIRRIPLGRAGRPEEVAELVAILAGDRLTFTTGACWDQSGGRTG